MNNEKPRNDELDKIKAALTCDNQSRIAYAGRVTQKETVTVFSEDGTSIEKEVTFFVSWGSISKILSLIEERAGVKT